MRYYSTQRPITPGSFPKPAGNEVIEIENFDKLKFFPRIGKLAWGFIEYEYPIDPNDAERYELIPAHKSDPYKVSQLRKMLEHETNKNEEHYGAYLTHWYGDSKPLTIDAGGLRALIQYYERHDTDLENGGEIK